MEAATRLLDLPAMHPRLLWEDIMAAALAVLRDISDELPFRFQIAVEDVPGFADDSLELLVDPAGASSDRAERFRRTYEPSRLVELAAIAIAGLALYHAGGHEIRDVALRGSGAHYLVDDAQHLLEIAGRSRRSDFAAAWQQRWQRLRDRQAQGFYLCVAEFETPRARLVFQQ